MSMVAHHLVHFLIAIWRYTLSDTRIVRGKKHGQCYHKLQCVFLRYLWMLEPVTFIAPLGTWKMDVEKSEFQVE